MFPYLTKKIEVRAVFSNMSVSLSVSLFQILLGHFYIDMGLPFTESRTHTNDPISTGEGIINLQRLLKRPLCTSCPTKNHRYQKISKKCD